MYRAQGRSTGRLLRDPSPPRRRAGLSGLGDVAQEIVVQQKAAQHFDMAFILQRLLAPGLGRPPAFVPLGVCRHPAQQIGPLLIGPQCYPKCALDFLGLHRQERLGRMRMSDQAAKAQHGVVHQVHTAATVRAGQHRIRLANVIARARIRVRNDLDLAPHFPRRIGFRIRSLPDEPRDRRPHASGSRDVVDKSGIEGRLRHRRIGRIRRILYDCQTAAALDGNKACGPVIQRARRNDTDCARTVGDSDRAEHRIDRRPVAVLARAAPDKRVPVLNQQMMLRRRHVDPAGSERGAVFGKRRGQRTAAAQDLGKHAAPRTEMHHDKHGRLQIGRQFRRDLAQHLHSPCGGADRDDVSIGQAGSFLALASTALCPRRSDVRRGLTAAGLPPANERIEHGRCEFCVRQRLRQCDAPFETRRQNSAAVARHEHERDIPIRKRVRYLEAGDAPQVDIQYGAIERFVLDDLQCWSHAWHRTDDLHAVIGYRGSRLHCDQQFVVHDKYAHAPEGPETFTARLRLDHHHPLTHRSREPQFCTSNPRKRRRVPPGLRAHRKCPLRSAAARSHDASAA